MIKNNKLKVISLFSGAGGLDIGFKSAGFEIVLAIEADPSCCNTLRKNNPFLTVIEGKVEDTTSSLISKITNLKPLEPALIIGGPPCQPFSLAGDRKGLHDPRGEKLLMAYIRIVRELLPTAFVMENVKGLANWDKGRAIDWLMHEFEKPIKYKKKTYKYTVTSNVLNAVDYGVSQVRERVFLVGNRLGREFIPPQKTYHPEEYNFKKSKKHKTVWDAIGKLPPADEPSAVAKRVAETIKGRIKKHGY